MRAAPLSPLLAILLAAPAAAQDRDLGKLAYDSVCSICHGDEGRGDGPLAPALKVQPADLTGLAAANGGVFPAEEVAAAVDGRLAIRGHGSPMPVWGEIFDLNLAHLPEAEREAEIDRRIRAIVDHLATLQR